MPPHFPHLSMLGDHIFQVSVQCFPLPFLAYLHPLTIHTFFVVWYYTGQYQLKLSFGCSSRLVFCHTYLTCSTMGLLVPGLPCSHLSYFLSEVWILVGLPSELTDSSEEDSIFLTHKKILCQKVSANLYANSS